MNQDDDTCVPGHHPPGKTSFLTAHHLVGVRPGELALLLDSKEYLLAPVGVAICSQCRGSTAN